MKKLIAAALLGIFNLSPVYAGETTFVNTHTNLTGVHEWTLKAGHSRAGYGFINDTDSVWHVRVFLNPVVDNNSTDRVTFNCNGQEKYLASGQWTDCDIDPGVHSSFYIVDPDFKNGAAGQVDV